MNLARWDTCHCLVLFIASCTFIFISSLLFFIIPASLSFLLLFFFNHKILKKLKPYAGLANWVTLLRFIAVFFLALIFEHLSDFQIACWLGLTVALDGADGYLARKRGQQTLIGAYLDMETDAFLVCIVCCILFIRGYSGYEGLMIGFSRYLYVFIVWILGFRYKEEKKTRIGPVIAVFVFTAIILSFVVPEFLRKILIYSALLLLIISFLNSFWMLLKE